MNDKWFEAFQSFGTFTVAAALLLHLLGHIKKGDK